MNRRDFLKNCARMAGGFALANCGIAAGGTVLSNPASEIRIGAKHPNVLFISIDDLNDWIGCMGGHPDAKTPNLDKLAQRAVLFTNAHCTAAVCNPSRASLMTGILPSTSGVYSNQQRWREHLPDAVTLPQYFMAHGYLAVGRGKIYHHVQPDTHPLAWHEYIEKGPDLEPQRDHPRFMEDVGGMEWGPAVGTEQDMDDYKIATWAIEKLQQKHDRPFFLACGFWKPHLPWHLPEKYFDMFPPETVTLPTINENDLDDVPPLGVQIANPEVRHKAVMEANAQSDAVAAYLAATSFADAQLGRIIDALDKSPYADNTVIILWGDHGWHLGEKLHWHKYTNWEEATQAPLMIVAPGITRPGQRCHRPVSFINIYPTLLDICALPAKKGLEGVSLVPLLKNPNASWQRPALTSRGSNNHSLRSERWRYIRYRDGTEELYDHDNDELEWNNLLWPAKPDPEHRRVADELAKWLPKFNY